jgi:hypothetical protein
MRRINLRASTALALILPVLMAPAFATNAAAQEKKDPRAGGAPAARVAPPAPVQHAAPPAPPPHIAAPVAATPHFAAPVQQQVHIQQQQQQVHIQPQPQVHIQQQPHFQQQQVHTAAPAHIAAPTHVAAPVHVAPHIATQQTGRPNFTRSNGVHDNAANTVAKQQQIQAHGHNVGPANAGNNVGAHDLAHRGLNNPNANNAARTVPGPNKTVTGPNNGPNNPNSAASKLAGPNKTLPGSPTPNALGQGERDRGRNAVNQQAQLKAQQQAQAQARAQIYTGHGKPVLHNQTFGNASVRDPALRAMAHATFQGGFARFHDHDRGGRRGFHGVVIGWGGPVFWPYAYADLVDYTFWPSANDTFWPYAYDDVYDGIFGAYAPDATAYANVPSAGRRPLPRGAITTGGRITTGSVATGVAAGGMAQICSGQASGLTDWPIERIAQQVQPTAEQRSLLDQLRDATTQAVNLLQSSCPTDLPSTPTGRLAAMRQRIEPMLQAVQTVRPALEQFYGSLSDEQKERFIALEAEGAPKATRQQPNVAQACGSSAKQIASLPIAQIQQLLRPNDAQRAALDALNNASAQAAQVLNQNCAPDQSLTPPGRVAAMEARLTAMLKALDTVQPAVANFYNSLTDEQKARFDRLGPRQG